MSGVKTGQAATGPVSAKARSRKLAAAFVGHLRPRQRQRLGGWRTLSQAEVRPSRSREPIVPQQRRSRQKRGL